MPGPVADQPPAIQLISGQPDRSARVERAEHRIGGHAPDRAGRPARRRSPDSCSGMQEKISTGRPSTTSSTCCTSRCQKPVSGRLSGGWACHRTRSAERACPPRPAGLRRRRWTARSPACASRPRLGRGTPTDPATPRLVPGPARTSARRTSAPGRQDAGAVPVGGGGQADALLDPRLGVRAAGVEHAPGALADCGSPSPAAWRRRTQG